MSTAVKLSSRYLNADRQIEIVENFAGGVTSAWAATATSGTVAALNERGGGISLTTQAADNAVGSLTLNAKPVIPAANKPISFAARIQFSEAATNAGNVLVGVHSGAVASALQDNGAGPPASYSGLAFFKADGSTLWSVEASIAGTQDTTELTAANAEDDVLHTAGSSSYQLLEIDVIPRTSTLADVIFKIDGILVKKIKDWTFTSVAAMAPVAVVKSGSTTAEVLKVNLMKVCQVI